MLFLYRERFCRMYRGKLLKVMRQQSGSLCRRQKRQKIVSCRSPLSPHNQQKAALLHHLCSNAALNYVVAPCGAFTLVVLETISRGSRKSRRACLLLLILLH